MDHTNKATEAINPTPGRLLGLSSGSSNGLRDLAHMQYLHLYGYEMKVHNSMTWDKLSYL